MVIDWLMTIDWLMVIDWLMAVDWRMAVDWLVTVDWLMAVNWSGLGDSTEQISTVLARAPKTFLERQSWSVSSSPSIHPPLCVFFVSLDPSLCVCLSLYLSHPFFYPFLCVSISPSVCVYISLCMCLYLPLSMSLCVYPFHPLLCIHSLFPAYVHVSFIVCMYLSRLHPIRSSLRIIRFWIITFHILVCMAFLQELGHGYHSYQCNYVILMQLYF